MPIVPRDLYTERLTRLEARLEALEEAGKHHAERLDELEVSQGAGLARTIQEWRRVGDVIADLETGAERRRTLDGQLHRLEDDRHELVIRELSELSRAVAQLREEQWRETTGLRELGRLQQQARSLSPPPPTDGSSAPSKADRWYGAKVIGAVTALVIALGTLATAIGDCATRLR
jgi:chromosome segregation ATPase